MQAEARRGAAFPEIGPRTDLPFAKLRIPSTEPRAILAACARAPSSRRSSFGFAATVVRRRPSLHLRADCKSQNDVHRDKALATSLVCLTDRLLPWSSDIGRGAIPGHHPKLQGEACRRLVSRECRFCRGRLG